MKISINFKICLSLLIGFLHSTAMLTYFFEPILSWFWSEKIGFYPNSPFRKIPLIIITLILFYLPLIVFIKANAKNLLYKIALKAVWTALPGTVFILFLVETTLENLGYRLSILGTGTYLAFAWALPIYMVICIPFVTLMFWDSLIDIAGIKKGIAFIIAVSLTLVPFLGVIAAKYSFYML